ncbi:MAG: efflux RND transporter periplasmic adaptor subunit [Rhizobiales bacterium]|nr:efflux RND transporter periplasmic adaptor subunit [Hyphomicrobiales bacterium]
MHGNRESTKKNLDVALKEVKQGFKTIGGVFGPLRQRVEALYEKSPLQGSKLLALVLVLLAVLWIGSGILFPHHAAPAATAAQHAAEKFRVAVTTVNAQEYQPRLVLSGRTEADKKVAIVSRTQAIITELRVKRGDTVKAGDVLAVLMDDGRSAQLSQARALVQQRKAEFEARTKLIEQGNLPKLDANSIASLLRAAEAALAQAEAEVERVRILAPWDGVVNQVSAELGQYLMMMPGSNGNEIAQMISLNPIIAIVEVSEKKLSGVRMGEEAELRLVSGEVVKGKVRYISKSAAATTRTYRVDIEAPNPGNKIPDGITTEVAILMAQLKATKVPRSALTFSAQGKLGVRAVNAENKVVFIPIELVDDEQQSMWVKGIADGTRVIVQGQDFVREDQIVEAVAATDQQNAQR